MNALKLLFISLFVVLLTACHHQEKPNSITVGTISGPETDLMRVAKDVALKKYGLQVHIVTFTDYSTPNIALSDQDIDANMFQHLPFLKAQEKARGYRFRVVGKVFIYPMGIYARTIEHLKDLPNHAKVGIPNDPTNEGRALLLLQKAGLIKLRKNAGFSAMPKDVVSNPKHLQFVELDAAELSRALSDLSIAAINTNYAMPAGLNPNQALFAEGKHSPYANILVVRQGDKIHAKAFAELLSALQSKDVWHKATALFGQGVIKAY